MKAAASAVARPDEEERQRPQQSLTRLLDELGSVLLQVSQSAYTATPLPHVSGSIGQHVRHILDHVGAFAVARVNGVVDYDHRERGTPVETDLGAGLRAILRFKAMVAAIDENTLERPVAVMTILERGHEPVAAWSTLGRELAFAVSHTVHHQALIAMLLTLVGDDVPEAFGLAPSTPRPASA